MFHANFHVNYYANLQPPYVNFNFVINLIWPIIIIIKINVQCSSFQVESYSGGLPLAAVLYPLLDCGP